MGETTPQDRQTAASRYTSPAHSSLRETALAFINAQSHNPSLPSSIDYDALRRLVTSQYTHTFGPAYAISQTPKLQGAFTIDSFIEHLGGMTPRLRTWEIEVKGCVVDEVGEAVVVRAGYGMWVKGVAERVENEVVWWLELEKDVGGDKGEGEGVGWRIKRSEEVVDPVAARRVRELMMGGGEGRKDSAAAGVVEEVR
ncbi:hypothetical protein SVAN01_04600 [Stagonosporopsis vannaccii]|nr:hypothetical protein SVAN01_04600 [Stagonosporopsis vannaccii]